MPELPNSPETRVECLDQLRRQIEERAKAAEQELAWRGQGGDRIGGSRLPSTADLLRSRNRSHTKDGLDAN
jgi:hypothetical protein